MKFLETLSNIIDEELQFEDDIDEASTSGAVASYNTPYAFSNKRKVDNEKEEKNSTIDSDDLFKKIGE